MSAAETRALVVSVRVHGGRFHGEPEWPPAPARLFQALVAGAARQQPLSERDVAALRWLESLPPPLIAAPPPWEGQSIKLYVPNNDLDASSGNPEDATSMKVGKLLRPRVFEPNIPFLYAWTLDRPECEGLAVRICELCGELYQLGRGVDMAAAEGRLATRSEATHLLDQHPGRVHRPSPGAGGHALACPLPGSLASLEVRHEAMLSRFQRRDPSRGAVDVFKQPPKPRFAQVAYDASSPRELFDIRPADDLSSFSTTPFVHAVSLVESLRDAAAERLVSAVPDLRADVERALIGRQVEGKPPCLPEHRLRIVPLPSIGHEKVDRGVRRVLVEVPKDNPLRAEDAFWAFSGLRIRTPAGVEAVVIRAEDRSMLEHYGVGQSRGARRWQTVTAAALPAERRRIEPSLRNSEAKGASERLEEETQAVRAVRQALRHAGVRTPVRHVRVQREPFAIKGARAEAFASKPRFPKERLWHVDVTFREPVEGPLVLGDGRFLGLGLFAPVAEASFEWAFRVTGGLLEGASPSVIAEATRRAVMARAQRVFGERRSLPPFVTGHTADGSAVEDAPHLAFTYDPETKRVLVLVPPPWRSRAKKERTILRRLDEALEGLSQLRAGAAGLLSLEAENVMADHDPLFGASRRWTSRTPYVVNRHVKRGEASAALEADLHSSLRYAELPPARVRVREVWSEPGLGLTGIAELEFESVVCGPILLGRTRFKGGGLFGAVYPVMFE